MDGKPAAEKQDLEMGPLSEEDPMVYRARHNQLVSIQRLESLGDQGVKEPLSRGHNHLRRAQ